MTYSRSYGTAPTRASGGRGAARFGPQVERQPAPETPHITAEAAFVRDTKNFRIFETPQDAPIIATVYVPLGHPAAQGMTVPVTVGPLPGAARSRAASTGRKPPGKPPVKARSKATVAA